MIPGLPVNRGLRAVILLGLAAGLAGCGTWLGEKEAPPLPGERIAVLFSDDGSDAASPAGPVVLADPQAADEWPQPGGNARHDSGHLDGAPALRQAWSIPVAAGVYGLSTAPVMAGGRVFTLDARYVLSAHAIGSGQRLWSVALENPEGNGEAFGGGLAFQDGLLFLTTGYGLVAAHDPDTGTEVWRQSAGVPIRAAPAVSGGVLLVVAVDNRAIAYAAADGRRLWTHESLADTAGLIGIGVPAIAGDIALVPQTSGDLLALRLSTGDLLWEKSLASRRKLSGLADFAGIQADPVVSGRVVHAVSTAGRLAAFDLASGVELWQRRPGGGNAPVLSGNSLFQLAGQGRLMALDRQNGVRRWQVDLPAWVDPEQRTAPIVWTGPLLLGNRLILGSSTGDLLALSPDDGHEIARQNLGEAVVAAPVAAGGLLFVRTATRLIAFR